MSNWDLVRTLEFELRLPRDVCERIVEIVTDSREFVTRAVYQEMNEEWDGEMATAEDTIRELQETVDAIRELVN